MTDLRQFDQGPQLAATVGPHLTHPPGEDRHGAMSDHIPHASHPAIAARLKRAGGHLRSVVEMIESGRPCLDIAQQLQAVESAIRKAKQALIHDHVDHCLNAGDDAQDIAALKAITRYL